MPPKRPASPNTTKTDVSEINTLADNLQLHGGVGNPSPPKKPRLDPQSSTLVDIPVLSLGPPINPSY